MAVIATAGHVDHGKSTLVRALTGMEPDRWAEERRRGMTIDLGYAWTELPSGVRVAFVDVPGHERFVSNMLAGVGPAPAAMIVIAADEGWRAQTEEHVAALEALGVRHAVVVVTRSDRADPSSALAEARTRIVEGSLAGAETLAVSGRTGQGLPRLRAALDRLVAGLPAPDPTAEPRIWVDRVFSMRGAGTVATGTLSTGRLAVGDEVEIAPGGAHAVVRGMQSCKQDIAVIAAVARVAVNLRGVGTDALVRGNALVAPGTIVAGSVIDVAVTLPIKRGQLSLHLGSAAVGVRTRPLTAPAGHYARLTLDRALPLRIADRGLLRDPGSHLVVAGVQVLDVDPPPLRKRGAATARVELLAAVPGVPGADDLIDWRGAVRTSTLRMLGVGGAGAGVHTIGDWSVSDRQWREWRGGLDALVRTGSRAVSLPRSSAEFAQRLGLPDLTVLDALVEASDDLEAHAGRVGVRGEAAAVSPADEAAVAELERHLAGRPFDALDAGALEAIGLDRHALAAAVAAGRLMRVSRDVYLLPSAARLAVERLQALPETFTVSEARTAWQTSRRVAVPLLQHLDSAGSTRRVDGTLRRLVH